MLTLALVDPRTSNARALIHVRLLWRLPRKSVPLASTSPVFALRFPAGPLPTLPEEPSIGDNTLLLSLQALAAQDYKHSLSLVHEALEQGITWDAGKAEALNLRGTFKCVLKRLVCQL